MFKKRTPFIIRSDNQPKSFSKALSKSTFDLSSSGKKNPPQRPPPPQNRSNTNDSNNHKNIEHFDLENKTLPRSAGFKSAWDEFESNKSAFIPSNDTTSRVSNFTYFNNDLNTTHKSNINDRPFSYGFSNTNEVLDNSISEPSARAIFDYASDHFEDLNFKTGDFIKLLCSVDSDWFRGINSRTNLEGIFPANHVLILVPLNNSTTNAKINDSNGFKKESFNEKIILPSKIVPNNPPVSVPKTFPPTTKFEFPKVVSNNVKNEAVKDQPLVSSDSLSVSERIKLLSGKTSPLFPNHELKPLLVKNKIDTSFNSKIEPKTENKEAPSQTAKASVSVKDLASKFNNSLALNPAPPVPIKPKLNININNKIKAPSNESLSAERKFQIESEIIKTLRRNTLSNNLDNAHEQNQAKFCTAIYDFESDEDTDLTFKAGDKIEILEKSDENWWKGKIGDSCGMFPSNYVSIDLLNLNDFDDELPTWKLVTCDFDQSSEGVLTLKSGNLFLSLHSISSDWIYCQLPNKCRGRFPLSYCRDAAISEIPTCRAICPFKAESADDLDIEIGDEVILLEDFDESWFKGMNIKSGQVGIFPKSFVSVIRDLPHY